MMSFGLGTRIKAQRKALGMTQGELAASAGVSRKFISELESGKDSASLGLTLKVLHELGFEEPALRKAPDRGEEISGVFRRSLAAKDYEYALRLVGEYAAESLQEGRPLLRQRPAIDDAQYLVTLAALTRWVASKTDSITPAWARKTAASAEPVFLSEKIYPVGARMKQLIRSETPKELREMNVWMRERSLATA